jgi:hypothetical protein
MVARIDVLAKLSWEGKTGSGVRQAIRGNLVAVALNKSALPKNRPCAIVARRFAEMRTRSGKAFEPGEDVYGASTMRPHLPFPSF